MDNVIPLFFGARRCGKTFAERERIRVGELLHGRVDSRRYATALARYDRNIANNVRPDEARQRVVKWALYALD